MNIPNENDIQEDIFAGRQEKELFENIERRESVRVKVKPKVPLAELAAPLLQKWGK